MCLTIGNFTWEAFKKNRDWSVATERSFFQGVAIITFLLVFVGTAGK